MSADRRFEQGDRPSRAQVVARYSGLARVAAAGGAPVDTPEEKEIDGCGGAVYAGSAAELGVPEGALRASMACGNPVAVAELLDLGSGGGLDVLLSARRVGPGGFVIGVDASPDMIELARAHVAESGVTHVEFRLGYLEAIPLTDAAVDVVISNCVFTLSTDKPRALAEAARVRRPGGRFGISDVLAEPGLDPDVQAAAEHATGCPVGTLTADEYHQLLLAAGFATTTIIRTHSITDGIYSAIVRATTPATAMPGDLPPPQGAARGRTDHRRAPRNLGLLPSAPRRPAGRLPTLDPRRRHGHRARRMSDRASSTTA